MSGTYNGIPLSQALDGLPSLWDKVTSIADTSSQDAAASAAAPLQQDIETLQQQVAGLLYKAPAISYLTTQPPIAEIGASLASIGLAWEITGSAAITAQTLTTPAGRVAIDPVLRTYTVSGPFSATAAFSLEVSDGTTTVSASASCPFENQVYWGASAAEALSGTAILALPNSAFAASLGTRAITYDCAGGAFPYLAYPASWPDPQSVTANGLPIAGLVFATVLLTNASGYASSYRTVRFQNLQNGSSIPVVWQ